MLPQASGSKYPLPRSLPFNGLKNRGPIIVHICVSLTCVIVGLPASVVSKASLLSTHYAQHSTNVFSSGLFGNIFSGNLKISPLSHHRTMLTHARTATYVGSRELAIVHVLTRRAVPYERLTFRHVPLVGSGIAIRFLDSCEQIDLVGKL
ncbi:hypothetical protein B0F90DRAFT_976250 [Multifurca ochricompacta]|uniref:Uncharacterized protein n=1 Tax=Multifurca ochricompacta TaxID=376703 RepID=A0AAD4QRN1_9AGAM|nr:hypothetical protein B0F90DRAFT_976250 [Multifurca ochricompacta]